MTGKAIAARRLISKRSDALDKLNKFKDWYLSSMNKHDSVILWGLKRDILCGTEDEIDKLMADLDIQNQNALFKKMSQ